MGKYKKCPRCELNYILESEELCDVCKAELGKGGVILIEDEDDEIDEILYEERICPECKINFLADDEKICPACKAELLLKKDAESKDEDDSWREFVADDIQSADSEEDSEDMKLSLEMLSEDETEEIFDDEEEVLPAEEEVFETVDPDEIPDDDDEDEDEDEDEENDEESETDSDDEDL